MYRFHRSPGPLAPRYRSPLCMPYREDRYSPTVIWGMDEVVSVSNKPSNRQLSEIADELSSCKFDTEINTRSPFRCKFSFKSAHFTFSIITRYLSHHLDSSKSRWYVGLYTATDLPIGENDLLEEYQECLGQVITVKQVLNRVLNQG